MQNGDFANTAIAPDANFGKPVPAGKKKSSGIGRWILGFAIVAIVISFNQFRTRDRVDAQAVAEGKIPAITLVNNALSGKK